MGFTEEAGWSWSLEAWMKIPTPPLNIPWLLLVLSLFKPPHLALSRGDDPHLLTLPVGRQIR